MSQYTHQTAPTQFLDANGIRFAYRRFGRANGVPLVFNQHYLGKPECTRTSGRFLVSRCRLATTSRTR